MNLNYDPNNPLTDKQLDEIAAYDFDMFLKYLDSKTEYLKTKTRPLNTHELKKINYLDAASRGDTISKKRYQTLQHSHRLVNSSILHARPKTLIT